VFLPQQRNLDFLLWLQQRKKRMNACVICGVSPADKCHIKSKGSGGCAAKWNIVSLCRACHQLQHRIGIITFYYKYPEFSNALEEKGWELVDRPGGGKRLWHQNLKK
jgi:hypothetical protein